MADQRPLKRKQGDRRAESQDTGSSSRGALNPNQILQGRPESTTDPVAERAREWEGRGLHPNTALAMSRTLETLNRINHPIPENQEPGTSTQDTAVAQQRLNQHIRAMNGEHIWTQARAAIDLNSTNALTNRLVQRAIAFPEGRYVNQGLEKITRAQCDEIYIELARRHTEGTITKDTRNRAANHADALTRIVQPTSVEKPPPTEPEPRHMHVDRQIPGYNRPSGSQFVFYNGPQGS